MDDEGIDLDTMMLQRLLQCISGYSADLGLLEGRRWTDLRREYTRDYNRIKRYADSRSDSTPNPTFVLIDKRTLNMLRKVQEETDE